MEILLAVLGLVVAAAAIVAVVVGRRRADPEQLVGVDVRLTGLGDDWWSITASITGRGRSDVEPSAFDGGRPITIDLGDASRDAEWYGDAPRAAAWSIASGRTLVLAPTQLAQGDVHTVTVVAHGRPEVRIDAPLRRVPVSQNVVETISSGAVPAPSAGAAATPVPHRVVDAPVDAPVRESVLRGGFGVWFAMGTGILGTLLIAVGVALSIAGASARGVGAQGVVLIVTAVVTVVGTLAVRGLRRWLEPASLWKTPRQRLRRPATIVVLALATSGLALFCLEFTVSEVRGESSWLAGLGFLLLAAGTIMAGVVGLIRMIVVLNARGGGGTTR